MTITHRRIPIILRKFGSHESEGTYTKKITDENWHEYDDLSYHLEEDERPLIVCKFNPSDWTLLTTKRILSMAHREGLRTMKLEELTYCNTDMQWEKDNGAKSLIDFTRLVLKDTNNKTFALNIEKGYPFGGFWHVLSYINSYKNFLSQ